MIRLLTGTVHSQSSQSLILVVNGVGYEVHVPSTLLEECDESLTLHIYSHIREDRFDLFGFLTKEDLAFFEQLIGINGVGPKMALNLLSQNAERIKSAIVGEDAKTLTLTPGVGKKIAERIILELKNKIDALPTQSSAPNQNQYTPAREDAISALESLGYKRSHISSVFAKIETDKTQTEELIRVFLQHI